MDMINIARGIPRNKLFRVWIREKDVSKKNEAVLNVVRESSDFKRLDENSQSVIIKTLINFCGQLRQKWVICRRYEKLFSKKHKAWLDGRITFSTLPSLSSTRGPGRPQKSFTDSSESVKRRKVRHLIKQTSAEELNFAARMSLRSQGKRDAAAIVKEVSCYSQERATNIKKRLSSSEPTKMTGDEALALYIDTKMTKSQYIAIRDNAKNFGANIYPSYEELLLAKKRCYPSDITISEISAAINLQQLVDHTIKRLLLAQNEVLAQVKCTELKIIFKWGADGAAGQSRYKQRFTSENDDDSFLFSISLVPLRLVAIKDRAEIIIWKNPSTSSTKYCRPIKIIFKKETREFVKAEIEQIQAQISEIVPYETQVNGSMITCIPELHLTMIDGKICSWLADTSGQCCHICGAKPKEFNNLSNVSQKPINENSLSFGISSLHAWIKVLECILHIAYRLDIKKWQIRKSDKEQFEAKKKIIQEKFRREMGLLIDVPKPGFGTSNDGNTARRVLGNAALASKITGVDESLISRLNVILIALACGYEIDVDVFENYCKVTAELYIEKYEWYYMPKSLHKILLHGALLINKAILPIGQMSEEAQEARNKDAKHFREYNARKFGRKQTMEDMIHMLLVSSDPLIASKRRKVPRRSSTLPKDVLEMLKTPITSCDVDEND